MFIHAPGYTTPAKPTASVSTNQRLVTFGHGFGEDEDPWKSIEAGAAIMLGLDPDDPANQGQRLISYMDSHPDTLGQAQRRFRELLRSPDMKTAMRIARENPFLRG